MCWDRGKNEFAICESITGISRKGLDVRRNPWDSSSMREFKESLCEGKLIRIAHDDPERLEKIDTWVGSLSEPERLKVIEDLGQLEDRVESFFLDGGGNDGEKLVFHLPTKTLPKVLLEVRC